MKKSRPIPLLDSHNRWSVGEVPHPGTAIVPTEPAKVPSVARPVTTVASLRPSDEWAEIWLAATRHQWSSLVIVPADQCISASQASHAVAEAARLYRPSPVQLFDATGATPADANDIVAAIRVATARGEQCIIAVDCPLANHAAIHVARGADAAALRVPLGVGGFAAARHAIDSIGRRKFIGSVVTRMQAAPRRK